MVTPAIWIAVRWAIAAYKAVRLVWSRAKPHPCLPRDRRVSIAVRCHSAKPVVILVLTRSVRPIRLWCNQVQPDRYSSWTVRRAAHRAIRRCARVPPSRRNGNAPQRHHVYSRKSPINKNRRQVAPRAMAAHNPITMAYRIRIRTTRSRCRWPPLMAVKVVYQARRSMCRIRQRVAS